MAMASVGNWIGGYLPTWVAQSAGVSPTGSAAYAGALLVTAIALHGRYPAAAVLAHTPAWNRWSVPSSPLWRTLPNTRLAWAS